MAITTPQWAFQKDGNTVITFTTLEELNVSASTEITEEIIEKGSFSTYNKNINPTTLSATLAIEGDSTTLQDSLTTLEDLKNGITLFSLVTPESEYENLTLESFDYSRTRETGNGILVVSLNLREVREVETTYTSTTAAASKKVSSPKNASNASKTNNGKQQANTGKWGDEVGEYVAKRGSSAIVKII